MEGGIKKRENGNKTEKSENRTFTKTRTKRKVGTYPLAMKGSRIILALETAMEGRGGGSAGQVLDF